MASPDTDNKPSSEPMPAAATRNLLLWASGFGLGVLAAMAGFVFLVGIGELGHDSATARTPAAKSAAAAPTELGRPPHPAPQTTAPTETTGQSPQAAPAKTPPGPDQKAAPGQR